MNYLSRYRRGRQRASTHFDSLAESDVYFIYSRNLKISLISDDEPNIGGRLLVRNQAPKWFINKSKRRAGIMLINSDIESICFVRGRLSKHPLKRI